MVSVHHYLLFTGSVRRGRGVTVPKGRKKEETAQPARPVNNKPVNNTHRGCVTPLSTLDAIIIPLVPYIAKFVSPEVS